MVIIINYDCKNNKTAGMSRKHCLCCVIAIKKQQITNRLEVKTDDINNKIAQQEI